MIIVMWVRGKEKLKGSTQKMKEKRNSIGVSERELRVLNERAVCGVIGTHFPPPTAGHIVRDGAGWKFV